MPLYTLKEIDRLDLSLQVRVRMVPERVERFIALYLAGVDLHAIVVFDTETGLVLADGYHRVAAFRRIAGEPEAPERIPYVVHQGTRAEAVLHALSTNDTGSEPLTPEDRIHNVVRLWREHRITYPRARERAPAVVLSEDERYEVARRLREERDPPTWEALGAVLGHSDGSMVHRWMQRGYAGRRQKPDKQRQIMSTLERLAALADAVGKQRPDAWARALIGEHVEAYRKRTAPPPDLRAIEQRLRVLANAIEARADEYEAPHRYSEPPD